MCPRGVCVPTPEWIRSRMFTEADAGLAWFGALLHDSRGEGWYARHLELFVTVHAVLGRYILIDR
jgi:hypothetical protein